MHSIDRIDAGSSPYFGGAAAAWPVSARRSWQCR
jgi:hypothetical protein